MCEIDRLFPLHIRQKLSPDYMDGLEEIRIRIGQPLEFSYAKGRRYLLLRGERYSLCGEEQAAAAGELLYRVTGEDIAEMLNYISNYSLYAYREEMKQGYITVEGGHRIGIAGQTAVEQGKVSGMHHISFLNIRVAHERRGCAQKLLPYIRYRNSIYNTLFLSEPGAGKTTYLRDCVRILSDGEADWPGLKVCVVDERSEIAACHMGVPQNDVGSRTDVLDGCTKAEGMLMLLRSMSPQVIAVDELGGERDFWAVEQAVFSGSRVLGTVHAGEMAELSQKPFLRNWLKRQVFRRFVLIERKAGGKRGIHIFDEHMERLC